MADDLKMPDMPDMQALVERVSEIMGGTKQALASIEADLDAIHARWDRDVLTIGRILRAHLHVEHYLTEYLQDANPKLGDMDEARLAFSQKIGLLPNNPMMEYVVPGIRHLNKIRNKLAHNLDATVTEQDSRVFLQGLFKAFREESARRADTQLSADPIDVLEEFAQWASSALQPTRHGKALAQAFNELLPKPE